jgi:hypothetical protein
MAKQGADYHRRDAWKPLLESCVAEFHRSRENIATDNVVGAAVRLYPQNCSVEAVLHKVAVLDHLYRTNIFAVWKMAKYITGLRLDDLLARGDARAVKVLRGGHRITGKGGGERNLYSFATKYCHWHRPDSYPMYDTHVAEALAEIRMCNDDCAEVVPENLSDFRRFKQAVDRLRDYFRLDWEYKRFDEALWILGQRLEDGRVRLATRRGQA